MKIYNYHPTTKEYLSTTEAYPSPLEPENYLIPANSTTIAPPAAKEKEAAVFTTVEWNIAPDYRGETTYRKIDQMLGEVSELGVISEEYTTQPPESPLQHWDEASQSWQYDFETYKKSKHQSVIAYADSIRVNLSSNASASRLASWNEKAMRASRVVVGNGTEADFKQLNTEALLRNKGETAEVLAARQVSLSDQLSIAVASVDGMETQALDNIEKSQNIEELTVALKTLEAQAEEMFNQFLPYDQL